MLIVGIAGFVGRVGGDSGQEGAGAFEFAVGVARGHEADPKTKARTGLSPSRSLVQPQSAGKLADGSSEGAGGVKTDAGTGTGGVLGTGGMGTDAGTGTGGAIGTGGVASDAGSGIACTDDGGVGLAAVARQCTQDSDCTILTSATCCGADSARGIAKAQANAYAGCFALPSGACSGLGCAKYLGYLTDTGKTTPFQGTGTQPIDLVSVGCLGHLCTTDVVPPADAGQDGPSAVDTAPDVGIQSCGSTTCHSGQACVLRSGGPDPLCQALGDGGCPPGLVYAFNLACPIFTNPAEQAEDGKNTGQGGTIGQECVSGQCMTFVMAGGVDAATDANVDTATPSCVWRPTHERGSVDFGRSRAARSAHPTIRDGRGEAACGRGRAG